VAYIQKTKILASMHKMKLGN